jgi:nucleoside-diphosphate-sugar epimerase
MMGILASMKGKTVVVTGASGYIGYELVDALVKQACKIIRVSRVDLSPLPNVKTIKADICNADVWHEILSQADIIYHLAGNTSVYEAAKYPILSLNSTLLPINHLIQVAQEQKRKPRVVFASTATVYGLTSILPVAETVKPNPITVYDLHKLFAEQQLTLASQQGVLDSVSLRLANVYGPSGSISSADDRGILNRATAMALQGKALTVYGDGNYLRDYVYITDVVNAFLLAGSSPQIGSQSFNIASGTGTTVKQVLAMVASKAGKLIDQPIEINYIKWPADTASIEHRKFTADIKKYKTVTGWNPRIDLNEGIGLMVNEFLKRVNKYDN